MNLHSTFVVYSKELKDILRDRRTILSMILFPIVIMPVLIFGISKLMISMEKKIGEDISQVVWIDEDENQQLYEKASSTEMINILAAPQDTASALSLLRERAINAVVLIPEGFRTNLDSLLNGNAETTPPEIFIYTDETREKSQLASRRIMKVIGDYRSEVVSATLVEHSLRPELVRPFVMMRMNIASAEEMGSFIAGSFLPYLLILMCLTGAMYAAIDLTAGEKERGTLETLLVSGVSRLDIVLGKFLTVFTASVVTCILMVGSLALTASGVMGQFDEISQELAFNIKPISVLLMIVLLLPLAATFSALLMTLSLFAKSYREAQTYISPLMILVIVPAMFSMMPGSEAGVKLAMIPVVNVSVLMKEALRGTVDWQYLATTMGVNISLACACLYLVLLMFNREKVLFRI